MNQTQESRLEKLKASYVYKRDQWFFTLGLFFFLLGLFGTYFSLKNQTSLVLFIFILSIGLFLSISFLISLKHMRNLAFNGKIYLARYRDTIIVPYERAYQFELEYMDESQHLTRILTHKIYIIDDPNRMKSPYYNILINPKKNTAIIIELINDNDVIFDSTDD